MAHEFNKIGLTNGSLVLIVFDTSYDYLKTFLAIQLLNASAVSIYPPSSIEHKSEWLEKSLSLIANLDLDAVATTESLAKNLKTSKYFSKIPFLTEVELAKKEELFSLTIEELDENAISFIQFSSGTTGTSKAIAISHKALVSNIESILDGVGEVKIAVNCVSWLPLYHDMGLVGALLATLASHGDLTLIKPEDFVRKPYLWLKAISDQKANVTVAPNFAYGLVAKRISDQQILGLDLSSLKVALCGAEMVDASTLNSFIKKFSDSNFNANALAPVYGMAEGTLAVSFSELNRGFESCIFDLAALSAGEVTESSSGVELCSVGGPVKDVEITILSDTGSKLPENEVGEIAFYSPALFSGTLTKSGLDKVEFSKTTPYRTGDQGFVYKNKLYICGRIKEMMIIRGKNYLPTSFESKIQALRGIRKGKVVAFSHHSPERETELVYVVAEHADSMSVEDKNMVKKQITKIFADDGLSLASITLVDSGILPRTTSGKLKRIEVKNIILGDGFRKQTMRSRIKKRMQKLFV